MILTQFIVIVAISMPQFVYLPQNQYISCYVRDTLWDT